MTSVTNILEPLTPLQRIEYVLMAVAMAVLPLSLNISVYAVYAAIVAGVVNLVVGHERLSSRVGARDRRALPIFGAAVLLWLCYAVSLLWTTNLAEGLLRVSKLLPLLLLALYFVAAAPAIYTPRRIRAAFWLQAAVLVVLFAVCAVRMLWRILFQGASYSQLSGSGFYPLHHAYMAYFLLVAVGFVYSRAVELWPRLATGVKVAMVAAIVALSSFIVAVNSRAGIIGLAIVALIVLCHITFVRRQWRAALIVGVAMLLFGGGVAALLPRSEHRLTNTFESDGSTSDARVIIYTTALDAICHQPWGYGAGDYMDVLGQYYLMHNYEHGYTERQNSHNQYLDTMLAAGWPAEVLLLALLLLFALWALRRRNVAALIFIVVTAENLLFEAMFYRQWGLLFFCIVYGLFLQQSNKKIT
ncbi:MAG: O-antigen ligase family protein [Bacteroidales bacterium]|nr:O-antigen ligase family protein [Bacteroidales bacterium]